MPIKSTVRCHLTLVIKKSTNNECWRGCGKRELPQAVSRNVNWSSHYGEQCGDFLKLKLELSYDPEIPLLDICLEKTVIPKNVCTLTFIAELFTIARTWKQPKHSLTEEWIKNMWHKYTMEYYSLIRRDEIVQFAEMWMDPETVIQSKVRKRKTYITY